MFYQHQTDFIIPSSFYFSTWYTYETYIDWQANPTITVVNTTSYPIENVEYPAITICSQGLTKDIMETVLIQQFETYLISEKIIDRPVVTPNTAENSNFSNTKTLESFTNEEV